MKNQKQFLNQIKGNWTNIIQTLHTQFSDLELDDNFTETPDRIARSYLELFSGLDHTGDQIEQILSKSFPSRFDNAIQVTDVLCFSMCPHHFLPVTYLVSIGYIPSKEGKVIGASKLGRVAEVLARRPVLQEDYIMDIVDAIGTLNPEGIAVLVSGKHMCMMCRGAKQSGSSFHVSHMEGSYKINPETRSEFFQIINLSRTQNI